MEFADYSPVADPTQDQQEDALRKGLGRVSQWVQSGHLSDDLLLNACLHDLRFDSQIDECRGEWLWQILTESNAQRKFRDPLLSALQTISDETDAEQLCELGFHYAQMNDEPFRKCLYEIVQSKPFPSRPWLANEQIVALDNESGLLFVVRQRGRELSDRNWDWDDHWLVDQAIGQIGEARVNQALDATSDPAIIRFRNAWQQHKTRKISTQLTHRERMLSISVDEIISAAEAKDVRYASFRGWGMHASEADLETVFARLLNAQETATIAKYLWVFSNRAFPRLEPRLFELCQHPDTAVRHRAWTALAQYTSPLVREFALKQLGSESFNGTAVELLINNYQQGDERLLFQFLRLPENPDELHWILMDVSKVLDANPQADRSQLGVLAYTLTPCANCRFRAARGLYAQHVAPTWLQEECRHDCESDARALHKEGA